MTPEGLERVRFAVLKLSGGEVEQLDPKEVEREGTLRDAYHPLCWITATFLLLVLVAALLVYLDPLSTGRLFDAEEWRDADTGWSISDTYPRRELVDGLIKRRGLIGLTRVQSRAMLGEPHWKDWPMRATAENDHHLIGPERFFLCIDDVWLFLDFDAEGRVERARLSVGDE